jgi:long-subunit acyl-CoA synthetase (AMP-forming)
MPMGAVVDRCVRVLKLSQGFFVSLSTLETTFLASPLVKQVRTLVHVGLGGIGQ